VPTEMETVVFRKEVFADLRPEAPPVGDLHTAHRLRLPGRWSLAAAAVGVLLTSVALASGLRESDAAPDPVQPLASGAPGAQPFLDRSDAPSPQAVRLAEASDPPEHLPGVDLPESLGSTSPDPATSDIAELGAEPAASAALPAPQQVEERMVPPPPVRLPLQASRSRIAAGGMHTCEIRSGTLVCWGGSERGQLAVVDGGIPSPVGVVAGGFHSCALAANGATLCWGENGDGQLGGGLTGATAPVRLGNRDFQSLALGSAHTCGVARDGGIFCWGTNADGQLGTGDRVSRSTPVRVSLDGASAAAVTAGWSHTCAISRDARAYCWGANDQGQLGVQGTPARAVPAAVTTDLLFNRISAGSAHTCALTVEGEAFCWGRNSDGRLGDGSTHDRAMPTAVRTSQRFAEISLGARHSCALTRNGTAFCWGLNNYGQLGTGETDSRSVPTRVQTDVRFVSIHSSGAHTCGTTAVGTSYCWGYNVEGQLGDRSRTHRNTPVRVQL
jgi:alpha-tubulin suppressor-like RCC1 family protein